MLRDVDEIQNVVFGIPKRSLAVYHHIVGSLSDRYAVVVDVGERPGQQTGNEKKNQYTNAIYFYVVKPIPDRILYMILSMSGMNGCKYRFIVT